MKTELTNPAVVYDQIHDRIVDVRPLFKAFHGVPFEEWYDILDETIKYMAVTENITAINDDEKSRLFYRLYDLRDAFGQMVKREE